MKIIVTGGLGLIGSRYVDSVLSDVKVIVVDSGTAPRNEWVFRRITAEHPNVEVLRQRVETTAWSSLLEDADMIVHAAAHTGIPHSAEDPDDDWHSNVDATRVILESMRKTKSKTILVALSSVKPYRVPSELGNGVDEETPLEPDEPYAASKMAQSGLVMAYARSYDLKATVLRCSNLYGNAPCHGPRHGWLTWFCIASVLGRTLDIQGTGHQSRDMLYCTDVTSAVNAAASHIEETQGKVYNIGGGALNVVSVVQAIKMIENVGINTKHIYSDGRKHEDMHFMTNFNKFNHATGWSPRVSVQSGIKDIVTWADKNVDELREIYKGL